MFDSALISQRAYLMLLLSFGSGGRLLLAAVTVAALGATPGGTVDPNQCDGLPLIPADQVAR